MKLKSIFLTLVFLSLFVCSQRASAETLTFIPGSLTQFKMSQTQMFKSETKDMFTTSSNSRVEGLFDVKVIAENEVEVSILKLVLEIIYNDSPNLSNPRLSKFSPFTVRWNFDSENSSNQDVGHQEFQSILSQLIGQPLHFKILSDFKIEETTGLLELVKAGLPRDERLPRDNFEHWNVLGISETNFALFLTHLFHLQGQKVEIGKKYPVSALPLQHRSIAYKITNLNGQELRANYHQKFKEKNGLKREVSERGIWNIENALEQSRWFEMKWSRSEESGNANYIFSQSWETIK